MKKKISISIAIILMASGLLTAYFFTKYNKTSNLNDVYFTVADNSAIDEIAVQLEKKSLIKSNDYFIYYSKVSGLKNYVKRGNYILKPKMKFKDLLAKLQSGRDDFYVITVPEGYTLYQTASKLEKNNLIKKDSLVNVKLKDVETKSLIPQRNGILYDFEGYLFPDTYYIPTGASEKDIIKLMFDSFKTTFSEKYFLRTKELGLNVNEVITIASLIEKEAANDQERSRISGVIYNRLKKGMLLQIDASVIYANTRGEKNLDKVYYNALKINSKYNTYLYKGLPPGPIASPGKASIEAALYPEDNDYLYYVASKNGHIFSKTYEDHIKNVKKYIK